MVERWYRLRKIWLRHHCHRPNEICRGQDGTFREDFQFEFGRGLLGALDSDSNENGEVGSLQLPCHISILFGVPKGIRTPVAGLKVTYIMIRGAASKIRDMALFLWKPRFSWGAFGVLFCPPKIILQDKGLPAKMNQSDVSS